MPLEIQHKNNSYTPAAASFQYLNLIFNALVVHAFYANFQHKHITLPIIFVTFSYCTSSDIIIKPGLESSNKITCSIFT